MFRDLVTHASYLEDYAERSAILTHSQCTLFIDLGGYVVGRNTETIKVPSTYFYLAVNNIKYNKDVHSTSLNKTFLL